MAHTSSPIHCPTQHTAYALSTHSMHPQHTQCTPNTPKHPQHTQCTPNTLHAPPSCSMHHQQTQYTLSTLNAPPTHSINPQHTQCIPSLLSGNASTSPHTHTHTHTHTRPPQLLINHGSDVFDTNADGETACGLAIKNNHQDVADFLEVKMVFAVSSLDNR